MRRFATDVVTRYKDSPAIWAWEFGNEWNLAADLVNAVDQRPRIAPSLGTPTFRTSADDLTTDMIRPAMIDFAQTVRTLDRSRVIESGNSLMRPSAWHQYHEKSWNADRPQQTAEMTLLLNPDPMNMLSVHAYYENGRPPSLQPYLDTAASCKKPLFVGEFGATGNTAQTRSEFNSLLTMVGSAPLSAMWVYDLSLQDGTCNVTPTNDRRWMLDAIESPNHRPSSSQRRP
jgi:hypothetical protein